jgi:chromosome segregation ATPase
MEVNTVFLCTAVGALVGTIVGVLLMNRKVRLPITGADLAALRAKVEATEAALAETSMAADDLRKQLAERDLTIQKLAEDLKSKQELIGKVAADAEKEKLQRSVDSQLSHELSTQNAALAKDRIDLEFHLDEERRLGAERAAQISSLETELEGKTRQVVELSGRLDGLTAELAALRSFRDQENRRRVSLEAQLSAEQERVQSLTAQVAGLESDVSRFDRKLQEERETAARGMELLLKAQENFSRVLNHANGEARTGEIRQLALDEAPASVD